MKTIINTKFVKNLALVAIALISTGIFAQEEEEKSTVNISGSVDAYFRSTFNEAGVDNSNSLTSFANQTGFALGMANVIASYETGSTGVVVDLVFGPRGTEATFNNDVLNGVINQAYAYWNVSEGTTLTIGRWNTFLGYEVIAPAANFNYSVSHLFSNGPFSHMGIKADFTLSDDASLMLAITNPWDTNDITSTGEYAFGAQLGISGQYLNLYYDSGKEGGLGFEIDYTGGFDLSDTFFLGLNAAYNTNSNALIEAEDGTELEGTSGFYGVAIYPQITTSDSFAIGLRGEYFASTTEIDGLPDIDDTPVLAATLTGSYTNGNLIIKPEIRLDSWGNDFEPFGSLADPSNSLASFTLAAIYSFD